VQIPVPLEVKARAFHAMVLVNQDIYIHGGQSDEGLLGDMWKLTIDFDSFDAIWQKIN
jgi:hypothetical protein